LKPAEESKLKVLLIGMPNAGKSTLFNLITAGNRKVSNYSGITVDSAVGEFQQNENYLEKYELVDLPGIYNLNPSSQDEAVAIGSLVGLFNQENYHKVILLVDWHRLEASLSLCMAVNELIPGRVITIINKDDDNEVGPEVRKTIEKHLSNPVLSLSALKADAQLFEKTLRDFLHYEPRDEKELKGKISLTQEALQYFPHIDIEGAKENGFFNIVSGHDVLGAKINENLKEVRAVLEEVKRPDGNLSSRSEKIDKVILNPYLGGLIFVGIFYLIFSSIYTWAAPLMDFTEGLVLSFGELFAPILPEGALKSLVIDGIIGGVGGVVVFLPQIMILFFLLSLLEQSGYISRAAVITDRLMSIFGLGGKAFLPYMSGFACAIPGIMAARTIPNQRERLATIMTLPLITCSARLPVYILLIGTFIPSKTILGIFNSQALAFFFLYFLGSIFALVMAKLLRLTFFKGKTSSFIIDLPHYQGPSLKIAMRQSWSKGKSFLKKAGTIILGLSILIWFLSSYPKIDEEKLTGLPKQQRTALILENSALGTMGKVIEPVIKPLGMNWKIGVGLLISFGARELFVSALGTIYALGDVDETSSTLKERLLSEVDPKTGSPILDLATVWAILIFFVFSLQCTSTIAVIKKETNSWKIAAASFFYMLGLAYGMSLITYNIVRWL